MKKKIGIGLTAIIVVAVIAMGIGYALYLPPGIEHLKEHPEAFRFEYLYNQKSFTDAVDTILEEGMLREDVERIIVNEALANKRTLNADSMDWVLYYKTTMSASLFCGLLPKGQPAWKIKVHYDEYDKLTKFNQNKFENIKFWSPWPCF